MIVGEVGVSRHDFLYVMDLWELNAVIKGYRKRARSIWEASRMSTWSILCGLGAKLAGPENLWPLPWEKETRIMTKEEVSESLDLINSINSNIDHEKD